MIESTAVSNPRPLLSLSPHSLSLSLVTDVLVRPHVVLHHPGGRISGTISPVASIRSYAPCPHPTTSSTTGTGPSYLLNLLGSFTNRYDPLRLSGPTEPPDSDFAEFTSHKGSQGPRPYSLSIRNGASSHWWAVSDCVTFLSVGSSLGLSSVTIPSSR